MLDLARRPLASLGMFRQRSANIHVRAFRDGDLAAILNLWRLAHAGLAGDIVRTSEYWRWCVLERPGVGAGNVFVTVTSGVVTGYSAIDTGTSVANVLELAVDPRLPGRLRRRSVSLLIDRLEDRAAAAGNDLVRFHVPAGDGHLAAVMRSRAYAPGPFDPPLQWGILDAPRLLSVLLQVRRDRVPTADTVEFVLEAEPGGQHSRLRWRVIVDPGNASVTPVGPGDRVDGRPLVRTDLSTLTAILFKATTVSDEVRSGRLRVEPSSEGAQAAAVLEGIAVDKPWHTPLADMR
jgi:hypothetical protein